MNNDQENQCSNINQGQCPKKKLKDIITLDWSRQSNINCMPCISDIYSAAGTQPIKLLLSNNMILDVVAPLPLNIICLNLSHNQISRFNISVLAMSATKLRELIISNNRLMHFDFSS